MNYKCIAHPVTPYEKNYSRRQVLAMYPSMQRQVFLDHHRMKWWEQACMENNRRQTLDNWIDTLN